MDTLKINSVVNCKLAPAPPTPLGPILSLFPLATRPGTPPPVNRTLDPKIIHQHAMKKLKRTIDHVQTAEDLEHFESRLDEMM